MTALYLKKVADNRFFSGADDRLLATKSDSIQWDEPRTVTVKLDYPEDGRLENVITYVEIVIEVKYVLYHLAADQFA